MKSAAVALLALSVAVAASGEAGAGGEDPFAQYLFPPDLVMGHAQALRLYEAQRIRIRDEVRRAQAKFVDLQFDLQGESEKLTRLFQESPVDEAKVLEQVDRILALEREIKKAQVGLLVRIRNLLTAKQLAALAEIRKSGAK